MSVFRCPFCNQPAHPIDVHGHVQCSRCGQNVDPCCGGEQACNTEALAEPARAPRRTRTGINV